MKHIILLLFSLTACASAQSAAEVMAQTETDTDRTEVLSENEYRMNLRNSADISVFINISGGMEVRSYAGNELRIEGVRTPPQRPEAAEGLRSLFTQATDNTNLGLSVTWEDNQVRISSARRHSGDYILHLPNKVRLVYQETSPGYGGISVRGHKGVLELNSTLASIDLHEVTGPALIHSQAGNIEIAFSELSQAGETRIQANAGNIDLSMPANTPANWHLRATVGDIFTDMDINVDGRMDMDNPGGLRGNFTLEGVSNGGGVVMNVRSGAGNIYIRKRE